MTFEFAQKSDASLPLWLIPQDEAGQAAHPSGLDASAISWATAIGFTAAKGQTCLLSDPEGRLAGALFGMGKPDAPKRERFTLARAVTALPAGDWHIAHSPTGWNAFEDALGWGLAHYRFDRYKKPSAAKLPNLVLPEGLDKTLIEAMIAGEFLTRRLIDTPTSDMGPDQLEAEADALAATHGAQIIVTKGAELADGFPMIEAVGRASQQQPRLLDLRFGTKGPQVTLVGKGVCFDTGGLDIKPSASMLLMKKDMGGAATVLGLADMMARTGLTEKIRLRILIPAVENSIAGNAMRPGDVLTSRKGLTVEVTNTDAEGRLVLADALAFAAEEKPDYLISMATLTGAARVALGPELPPFYCDDEGLAGKVLTSAQRMADPVWRMPFWDGYEAMLEPDIADLDNAPKGGFAGSITAALFLRRFTGGAEHYAHFDIYGWQPAAAPARPKGGQGQGARAVLDAIAGIVA